MSKKIVFIIVEGISEKNALEGILKVLLQEKDSIEIVVYDGDILTSLDPISKITQKCHETLSVNGFLTTDLAKIVQVSDLDGCYIDDSKIVHVSNGRICYKESTIECTNVPSIKARNLNKRNSINLLRATNEIQIGSSLVPFELYYNSCNLEHVLYNSRTMSKKQKTSSALRFALTYDGKESDFITFIEPHSLAKTEDELWEHVKDSNNSLQKSSTLYFLLKEDN